MIYVGIDVAKDKHDCFITNSDGEVLFKAFTISNNLDGFNELYQKIESVMEDTTKVKVGLEATGHYSYNLLGYLIDKGLPTYVINPLHTNLYRKSLSLRQTKTDKVDAHIWKSEALDIYATLYIILPNMSVYGIQHLLNILQRNGLKASITMLPYLMPLKNWFELFTISLVVFIFFVYPETEACFF